MEESQATETTRVLIVEDESIVAMDIEQELKKLGYAVCGIADTGEKAIKIIEGRAALSSARRPQPSLVLMDIRLKGAMSGIDAARQIWERWRIPVVFLTAHADDATLQRAKLSEPFGYLLKPFEERKLHTVIEIALQKHRTVSRERTVAEDALFQSEENLRLLIESISDYAILMLDREGRFANWNKAAERMTGYTAFEMIGKDFSVLAPSAESPASLLKTTLEQGRYSGQGSRTRKDGSKFWADVVISPLHDKSGQLRGFAMIVRDITERRAAEQAVAENERKLRSILDNTPSVVFLKDLQGRNTFANRGFATVLNRRREDIEGKTDAELFPGEFAQAFRNHDGQIARTGEAVQFEEKVPQADGVHTYVSEKFPLRDAEGKVYAICAVATDITERKRMEDELRRLKEDLERRVAARTAELQETVEQLQAFSYTLSHDLRAPIRTVQGFTQIIREECEGKVDPSTMSLMDEVLNAGRRMDRLILDVLELSRVSRQDIRVEPLDTDRLVRGIIGERPELHPPSAIVTIEGRLEPALGHIVLFSQCITNLLSNAVKFVRPGELPQVRIYSEQRNGRVRISIEDNGIGIAPEAQERIFEIFTRLHKTHEYEGTGIGLAIVRKASERMGGSAGVESAPGQGSRFWIELPALDRERSLARSA